MRFYSSNNLFLIRGIYVKCYKLPRNNESHMAANALIILLKVLNFINWYLSFSILIVQLLIHQAFWQVFNFFVKPAFNTSLMNTSCPMFIDGCNRLRVEQLSNLCVIMRVNNKREQPFPSTLCLRSEWLSARLFVKWANSLCRRTDKH